MSESFQERRDRELAEAQARMRAKTDFPIGLTDDMRPYQVSHASIPLGDRVHGMLAGGALGEAIGRKLTAQIAAGQVRPMSELDAAAALLTVVRLAEGPLPVGGGTQLMLFTGDGLIRCSHTARRTGTAPDLSASLRSSYQRWLYTQHHPAPQPGSRPDGALFRGTALYEATGVHGTATTLLEYARSGRYGTVAQPINSADDHEALLRIAPLAVLPVGPDAVFRTAVEAAALTHGHPDGHLPAGVLAALLKILSEGAATIEEAFRSIAPVLRSYPGWEPTYNAVERAVGWAITGPQNATATQLTEEFGSGDTAVSALALAIAASPDHGRRARGVAAQIAAACHHLGDLSASGMIAGQLAGIRLGFPGVPANSYRGVTVGTELDRLSLDLQTEFLRADKPEGPGWELRYPIDGRPGFVFRGPFPLPAPYDTFTAGSAAARLIVPKIRGTLVGGAAAEAIAYELRDGVESGRLQPVQYLDQAAFESAVREVAGSNGLRFGTGTRLTMFSAEAAIRADRSANRDLLGALRRGLQFGQYVREHTWQQATVDALRPDSPWVRCEPMYARRDPAPVTEGNDCGALIRSAPLTWWWVPDPSAADAFRTAVEAAALTHGHPDGRLPAGMLAGLLALTQYGNSLPDALAKLTPILQSYPGWETTQRAISRAVELGRSERRPTPAEVTAELGDGRTAPSALAIAIWAYGPEQRSFLDRVTAATYHHGDTTAASLLVGQLTGAQQGITGIPNQVITALAGHEAIDLLGAELFFGSFLHTKPSPAVWEEKYPAASPVTYSNRVLGSLVAGAIGDALGYPIEFNNISMIRSRFGEHGLTDYVLNHLGEAEISDDTQMTLFTLEGLIRAHRAGAADPVPFVQHAYQRWLHTQNTSWENARGSFPEPAPDGWLITHDLLFRNRAPGATCMSSLRKFAEVGIVGTPDQHINDSKGCGGVMRVAPVALWPGQPDEVFAVSARIAALTHGHPSGYLSAGTFTVIIGSLIRGTALPVAIQQARSILITWDGHEEQVRVLDRAVELAAERNPSPELIADELGGGWVGEEALAIGLYAALCTDNVRDALLLGANHTGDSDSTAAIAGNLVGAMYGLEAVPQEWRAKLELGDVITEAARDLLREFSGRHEAPDWAVRYPAS
ncbi:ADP-ribosylglycohydrolase family protein [Pseudonocardiaceae bacterium YIM PH 21723]|nr:ADP-ribosylglycohydrolase family protein [Pseudonocardiaceae bacterium YIM PH 21723]